MRLEKRPAPDGDDNTGDGKNIGNVGIFGSSKFGPFNVTESPAPKKAKPVVTKQEDSRGPGASPFVSSTTPRGLHEPCVGIGRLSKSIVAIRAGPGRETFFVHPHLLMGCSEFRRQLGTVANGVTEIDLPDEDPDIISLMIFWCYEVCTFNAPREVSGLMMDYARYLFDKHGTLFTFASNKNPSVANFMAELRTVEKYSKVSSENPLRRYAPPAEDVGKNNDDSKEGSGQV
ncbi:hypothetical protein K4K54_001159 [Colletotrichum sp. SAR 10_86]|nr:hypothetical protein K4K51_010176 [Colletotrichum sp. SAR 10_75]KAI8229948.1 hypothetical protein K4K54_001159 [Colletotrichum sp. SAR 10_86]